ncbi:hypothetical protein BS78_07G178100 [Paspalum vaginatum]|nr:hypothetical protein BS78_07G178100 [Paspalum vaginatum]
MHLGLSGCPISLLARSSLCKNGLPGGSGETWLGSARSQLARDGHLLPTAVTPLVAAPALCRRPGSPSPSSGQSLAVVRADPASRGPRSLPPRGPSLLLILALSPHAKVEKAGVLHEGGKGDRPHLPSSAAPMSSVSITSTSPDVLLRCPPSLTSFPGRSCRPPPRPADLVEGGSHRTPPCPQAASLHRCAPLPFPAAVLLATAVRRLPQRCAPRRSPPWPCLQPNKSQSEPGQVANATKHKLALMKPV